jgi:uncharacterized protein YidB (DUF937 family)
MLRADAARADATGSHDEDKAMGLLDGLLGQVLGGMGQQRGGNAGGLEDLLNQLGRGGMQGGAQGGGGLGDLLNQMGGGMQRGGGMPGGMQGGGGLGDLLNQMGGSGAPSGSAGAGSGMSGALLGGLVMIALQMLQRNGGLGGVLGRMKEQGYGNEADSWVGTGENAPIPADVLSQILGRDVIDQSAREMGISPDEAAGGLAQVFPEIVNEITPNGRVDPGSDDIVAKAMEILQRGGR